MKESELTPDGWYWYQREGGKLLKFLKRDNLFRFETPEKEKRTFTDSVLGWMRPATEVEIQEHGPKSRKQKRYEDQVKTLLESGCEIFKPKKDCEQDFEFTVDRDPEALHILENVALAEGTIIVWTSPSTHADTLYRIATLGKISLEDAEKRVHEGSQIDQEHGSKFDLILPNVPELVGLNKRLGLFFNPGGMYSSPAVIKISNVVLTDKLMSMGLLPSLEVPIDSKENDNE